jgi:WXG100 family type VII secretion target
VWTRRNGIATHHNITAKENKMVDIRVSPERLRQVAATLDGQREQVEGALTSAISSVQALEGEWTGMAQVDYAQIFNSEVPPMRTRMVEILDGLSNAMRRIATAFEETDQQVV